MAEPTLPTTAGGRDPARRRLRGGRLGPIARASHADEVAVRPPAAGAADPAKPSKLEVFKEQSRQLRGTIAGEFQAAEPNVSGATRQLLKFHGLYEQDDRDRRQVLRRQGTKAYSFMVRSKIPGGRLTAAQYLAHDELAGRFGNGTLRITARQDFQLHGVIKRNVKPTLRAIHEALLTTFGACGDVVRNVTCCPVPAADPVRAAIEVQALAITARLMPRTGAYHEMWLDGEPVRDFNEGGGEEEPIYGKTYLPRKFKIGIAYPGDNCVDVFTQDVGAVAVLAEGKLSGFNVLVGGGQGMTHRKAETFPRLADPLAFVAPEELVDLIEHIVCVQRDHGDRTDRRHARLKYLIHDRGLDWFRREVERRRGRALEPPVSIPPFTLELHLGWRRQAAGEWSLGLPVENGRIRDENGVRLRTGLRAILKRLGTPVTLTPHQDLLLTGLSDAQRRVVEAMLDEHGIPRAGDLSTVRLHSMACPALPTCGLALSEAERALPSVLAELEVELARLGLARERLTVRMTGCPNGCARPYVADLAFVGRSLDRFLILVGGRSDGTRLNQAYQDLVPGNALVSTVVPLLTFYKQSRKAEESFGDFCNRVGVDGLHAFADAIGGVTVHDQ